MAVDNVTMVLGGRARRLRLRILADLVRLAFRAYRRLALVWRVLQGVLALRRQVHGDPRTVRFTRAGGRWFWTLDSPGWPSPAFDRFIRGEFNRVLPLPGAALPLQTVIFAITNRCPLRCRHCYEWDNLEAKDRLNEEDLLTILARLQEIGTTQIQFSGGEPLARFDSLLRLVGAAAGAADCWILTSGYGLTAQRARALQQAGLVGANISLDHWDAARHNEFRDDQRSFDWVRDAAANCIGAGIIVSLSLCATREFVTDQNLAAYHRLARDWGASFVRVLEPRPSGRFAGRDVELDKDAVARLERFFIDANSDPRYRDFPTVAYPGYHQRRTGCFGAGARYLHIDSNGDYHACPFCQRPHGNALTDPIEAAITSMRKVGCHAFPSNRAEGVF